MKDAEVIKEAKFAIKKVGKKEKATVTLVSIKKARMQVVAGLNYELCLEVDVKKAGKKSVKRSGLLQSQITIGLVINSSPFSIWAL